MESAVNERWRALGGLLVRTPFKFDHAKAALRRIIAGVPPSGSNNEQFRDACIWETALEFAAGQRVHLVTADLAFYEGRNRTSGLSPALVAECSSSGSEILLHSSLDAFLRATSAAVPALDEGSLKTAIIAAATPLAEEIASGRAGKFALGKVLRTRITGYATPSPSQIAVSFNLLFSGYKAETREGEEARATVRLDIKGGCLLDPNTHTLSEVEVTGWSSSVRGDRGGGISGTSRHHPEPNEIPSKGAIRYV